MQVEVYVAFSISGSFTFIRANKKIDLPNRPTRNQTVVVDGINFKVSEPRQGTSQNNGVKLLAAELDTAYNSKKPEVALNFFHVLKNKGWNVIDEDKFVQRHNLKKPIPALPVEQVVSNPVSEPVMASANNSETTVETVIPPVVSEPGVNTLHVKTTANEFGKAYMPGPRQVAIMEFMKLNTPMNLTELHSLFKSNSNNKISLSDFRDSVNGLIKFGRVVEDNGLLRLA